MRAYSTAFEDKNGQLRKETRWTIEISFNLANTDLYYFTSHADCEVPTTAASANVYYNVLRAPIVSSQKLNVRKAASSIGGLSFDLIDPAGAITTLLNAKLSTPELVTDGEFASACGVNWTCGTGWAIAASKATHTAGTASSVSDTLSLTTGKEYLIQYTVTGRTAGTVTAELTGGTTVSGTSRSADGIYTEVIIAAAGNTALSLTASSTFDGAVSLVTMRRMNGDGLRHKRVRIYRGYRGLAWDDYQVPPGGTQIIDDKIGYHQGKYTFRAKDRQRSSKKKVFELKTTNLTSNYTANLDSVLNVTSTTGFEMIDHGTSFSHLPSTTVGYVEIEGVAFSYTNITPTTFTGVTGGVLNTKDIDIEVDATVTSERRPECKEIIYLEMPAPKLAYAIYTNSLYNQAATIPAHWGLEIAASDIATSMFTSIGNDLWDPTNDTIGRILRFDSLKSRDAKKFIQEQLYLPMGLYPVVLADGQLGVKRMHRVLSDASPVVVLDETNTLSFTSLSHDLDAVANLYTIKWNWEKSKEKTTRLNGYIDTGSNAAHGPGRTIEYTFEGLHGSLITASMIANTFDSLRDRYSGPPELLSVTLFQSLNGIEIGDVVQCKYQQRDFVGGADLDRAFEVQGYRDNGSSITLSLFGSSQEPGILRTTTAATVLDPTFYSAGLLAGNKLDAVAGLTTSLISGILHITGSTAPSVDLPGGADATATSAIYWYPGVVKIHDGVDVWFDQNIQIRCYDLIIDGKLLGTGKGLAGATNSGGADFVLGTAGKLGSTVSGGGIRRWVRHDNHDTTVSRPGATVSGTWSAIPVPNLTNNDTSVGGILNDLRGSSGSSGASVYQTGYPSGAIPGTEETLGGAGGAGGAGLVIVSRSVTTGANGSIDISGAAGTLAAGTSRWRAGSGAGGAPGGLLILLDGNGVAAATLTADHGATPIPGGTRLTPNYLHNMDGTVHSYFEGLSVQAHDVSNLQVYPIPPNETVQVDVSEITDPPTAIAIAEATATKNTLNIVYLEISVTSPAATNYRSSMIYIRKTGTDSWQQVGETAGAAEVVVPVPADGSTYEVKAHGISLVGVESPEFFGPTSYTVSTSQVAVIGANNALATSTTTGDGTNGEGVKVTAGGITGYDTSGVLKFFLDALTGVLTASSAVISGSITAASGFIGGWTIQATGFFKGNLAFDSANTRIQAGPNAGDYVRIDPNGIVGVDSVLGTTFNLPTDGSAPTFSSGIINSTVFNITTAGILETSATAGDGSASGQGVRINDIGIKGWAANDATPNFFLSAVDGTISALDATITGGGITLSSGGNIKGGQTAYATGTGFFLGYSAGYKFSIGSSTSYMRWTGSQLQVRTGSITTKSIDINPSGDNEIHFYGNRGDGTVEELATIGINAIGSDSVVGSFGTKSSGNSKVGIYARAYNTTASVGNSQSGVGVFGLSTSGSGVKGSCSSSSSAAIDGVSSGAAEGVKGTNTSTGNGVYGLGAASKIGVLGNTSSGSGVGVKGLSASANPGVWGDNTSTGNGVYGSATSSGNGVQGFNNSTGTGVFGQNTGTGAGVFGTAASSGIGVAGSSVTGAAASFTTTGSGTGVNVLSSSGYGAWFRSTTGPSPLIVGASTSGSVPVHFALKGSLWVSSPGTIYINTNGSTTWAKIGGQ